MAANREEHKTMDGLIEEILGGQRAKRLLEIRLRDRGLLVTPELVMVLATTAERPLTVGDIEKRIHSRNISYGVARLEEMGLVQKHRAMADARIAVVEITDKGRALLEQARGPVPARVQPRQEAAHVEL